MADNVVLDAGVGGATAATDDIGGVHFQRVKVTWGTDGTANDASASNPLPVTVVSTTALTPGTAAANLGKAEDVAHASGDTGVLMLGVRRDTPASGADTDGDYATLNFSSSGYAYTLDQNSAAALTALQAIEAAVEGAIPAGTNNIGNVDVASIAAGDNNIGNVDVVTVPTDPFGANADAASATGSISAKLRFIASTGIPVTGTVTVAVASLPASTNTIEVVGDAAHDAAIAGNPVRIAGRGMSADYTAVATGDTVDLLATLLGKLVVQPYALPGSTWSSAAGSGGITNTTAVTVKAAAGAGIRNYVTSIDVVNTHATVDTEFMIRDGAAGTVLWRTSLKALGGGVCRKFDPPLRGTANTLIEIVNGTTGAAVYANLSGYVAAE